MILVASQRGDARQLAAHLLNDVENDHVTLAETRGFMAHDLRGALDEADAIAKATRCKQFLFSLSLNPPITGGATVADLMAAVEQAEERLGLKGQPRAVVIHEKQGRRHAHVVWSRIDAAAMKAVNMPYYKTRLARLSKDLYLEHGWELPLGHRENGWKNPLNFTLADWQQAKRLGLDPREVRQIFQDAWRYSDNGASFRAALEVHGYYLARGDRRGFVAVDLNGEVFALARLLDLKTKAVVERLGDPHALPSVADTQASLRGQMSERLRGFIQDTRATQAEALAPLLRERQQLVESQRRERKIHWRRQGVRRQAEMHARASRLRRGLIGLWDRLTGRAATIRRENERDSLRCWSRDRDEREGLARAQAIDRRALQSRLDAERRCQRQERQRLTRQVAAVLRHSTLTTSLRAMTATRARGRDMDFTR